MFSFLCVCMSGWQRCLAFWGVGMGGGGAVMWHLTQSDLYYAHGGTCICWCEFVGVYSHHAWCELDKHVKFIESMCPTMPFYVKWGWKHKWVGGSVWFTQCVLWILAICTLDAMPYGTMEDTSTLDAMPYGTMPCHECVVHHRVYSMISCSR